VLGSLEGHFARRPRCGIELDALRPLAFDDFFKPQKNFGVHRLRAGIAAPEPSRHRCKQEQRECPQNHQQHKIDRVLGPENKIEKVKLASINIEQNCLSTVPRQPAKPVKKDLR
jgi:hypothetical protein